MKPTKDTMNMRRGEWKNGKNTAPLAAYKPADHGQSVCLPMVDTSTYTFPTAEDGKYAFAKAYSLGPVVAAMDAEWAKTHKTPRPVFNIYSRISGPTIQACEQSLVKIEPGAEWAMVFPSGMAAINTAIFATCHHELAPEGTDPVGTAKRDVIIHSKPLYGGTYAATHVVVQRFGFTAVEIDFRDPENLRTALKTYGDRVALVFLETPANPTLDMLDIKAAASVIDEMNYEKDTRPVLAVDNTFAGVFQSPLKLGADLAIYSVTKYMGGHADLIGGALIGTNRCNVGLKLFTGNLVSAPLSGAIGFVRTIFGYTTAPEVAHKLWKHLQTYNLRMKRSAKTANTVAKWLAKHKKVEKVNFPTMLKGDQLAIFQRQMTGTSSMIGFRVKGDSEAAAFRFIDSLQLILRAVSLGSNQSLIDHPMTWTHSDIMNDVLMEMDVTPGFVRLSIGIEDAKDLIHDLNQALKAV